MTTNKFGIGTLLIVMLLVSFVLVPAVSGKADGLSSTSSNAVGKVVVVKSPELKVIKSTNTSYIAQVGDLLITYESDPKYTEANMELKNLTTKEVSNVNIKVTESKGKFTTELSNNMKKVKH